MVADGMKPRLRSLIRSILMILISELKDTKLALPISIIISEIII